MVNNHSSYTKNNQKGAVAPILVLLFLLVLIPIGALAIDLAFLYVARNELQNAADSGALAGARNLYNNDGTSVYQGANQIAYDTAILNNSFGSSVEINWVSPQNSTPSTPEENWYDVERGHWSFGRGNISKGFTPNNSTAVIQDIWQFTDPQLDDNLNFINAVRVVARREATPVTAFFSRLFGYSGFTISAESIAYLGFAGSIEPEGFDYPIAICRHTLLQSGGGVNCNIGRMLENNTPGNTAVWTDFEQPCDGGGINTGSVRATMDICGKGNSTSLQYGQGIDVGNAVNADVFSDLLTSAAYRGCPDPNTHKYNFERCWKLENEPLHNCPGNTDVCGYPTKPWPMRLPVVDCLSGSTNCRPLVGAIDVVVLWIADANNKPDEDAPCQMDGYGTFSAWSNNDPDGQVRWNDFVTHFNLQTQHGTPALFSSKTVYFAPECTLHEPTGLSGGDNFGILAKVPVLVK